jgi:hypothetical protein
MAIADHTHTGSCHCGGVTVELAFTKPAEQYQLRSCQCDFCTRHGSVTVSDPGGMAIFHVAGDAFSTYSFGTRTARSLLCRTCGVYAGALQAADGALWSVASVRGLAIAAFRGRPGEPVTYDQETPDQRIARRRQRWTPTEIRFKL